jgi:hypothetical protein
MADRLIKTETLADIADAIRKKRETAGSIRPSSFASEIRSILTKERLLEYVTGALTNIKADDLEGATTIVAYGFCARRNLKSVELPNTVTSIQTAAFKACSSLEFVKIPQSVLTISDQSFYYCTSLETVVIERVWPTYDFAVGAFAGCNALKRIIVPKGSLEMYKEATNWSAYADIMEEAAE